MKPRIFVIVVFFGWHSNVAQSKYSNQQIDSLFDGTKYGKLYKVQNRQLENLYASSLVNDYKAGQVLTLLYLNSEKRDKSALRDLYKAQRIAASINNHSLILYVNFVKSIKYNKTGFAKDAVGIIIECYDNIAVLQNEKSRNFFRALLYKYSGDFLPCKEGGSYRQDGILFHKAHSSWFAKFKGLIPDFTFANTGLCFLNNQQLNSIAYCFAKAIEGNRDVVNIASDKDYFNLAKISFEIGNYDEALAYLDSSLVNAKKEKKYSQLSKNYALYSDLYTIKGDPKNSFKHLELALLNEKLNKKNQVEYESGLLDLALGSFEDNTYSDANRVRLILFFSLLISFLVLSLELKFSFRRLKEGKNVKRRVFEIEAKNKEIASLKQKVSISYEELIVRAKKNDPLFCVLFKGLFPDFYDALLRVNPTLTLTEQKVCFYIKLKFSTKEIATATFVSVKAIQNRKNRLRKRLKMKEGEDLYSWMENIT